MKSKVYLDSSIFIYHFENKLPFSEYTKLIFELGEKGEITLGTSSLTFTEITPIIFRSGSKKILSIYFSIDQPPLSTKIINLDKEIAFLAGEIRAEYNFKTPESIHLASAMSAKYDIFLTNDKNLVKCKDIKILLITEIRNIDEIIF